MKPRAEGLEGRLLMSADGGAIQASGGRQILEFQGTPLGHAVDGGYVGEVLAEFSESSESSADDFHVTIDWGDQTAPSSGHVVRDFFTSDFDVKGDHAYAQTGSYVITVTIEDGDGRTATVTDQATIMAGPLASTPTDFNTVVGRPFENHMLGEFYDAGGLQSPEDYHVTIDWGDGTTSLGNLDHLAYPGGHAPYLISYGIEGSHTYQNNGHYAITVSVTDDMGHSTTMTTQAAVALEEVESPVPVLHPNGKTLTDVQLATLAIPGGTATAGDFAATIDWGDGSPTTTGQVSEWTPPNGGPPRLVVHGSHTYAEADSYSIKITVTQDDGATLVAVGPAYAIVSDAMIPIHPLPPWNPPVVSPPLSTSPPSIPELPPIASSPPPVSVTTGPQVSSTPIQSTPTGPIVKAIRHRKPVRRHPLRNTPTHPAPTAAHGRSHPAFAAAVQHRKGVIQHHRAIVQQAALAASQARARKNHLGS